jgi:hypothetical protein
MNMFNAIASDRCDDAKLGKMHADRIDHCGLLANEQMARAVKHQAASASRIWRIIDNAGVDNTAHQSAMRG